MVMVDQVPLHSDKVQVTIIKLFSSLQCIQKNAEESS